MARVTAAAGFTISLLAGAVTWFVLDVILGVAVWVSFVAGGGVLLVGVLLAIAAGANQADGGKHGPRTGSPLRAP
jgi:hypothetical protein